MTDHCVPTLGIGLTGGPTRHATLGIGLGPSADVGAGKRRWILPNGQITDDPQVAYLALERHLRARAAELDRTAAQSLPARQKRKRSRSIHPPKGPSLLAEKPLTEIIDKLPESERARLDLNLIALAKRLARERDDEEAILLLLN